MSYHALALKNRSCAVVQWNAITCSSGNTFARDGSLTVNRWSAAGDVFVPMISSGKSLMMFLMYSIMVTITFPFGKKLKIMPRWSWTFPRWVYFSLSHSTKMVTWAGSQCDTVRSSTCQQTVICFPSTTLLATHESYGFSTKPSLSKTATSLL
jgi:hypothetical protein